MSNAIPFPPAPEPGWYADDPVNVQASVAPAAEPAAEPAAQQPQPTQQPQAVQPLSSASAGGLAATGLATGTPVVTGTFVTNQSQAQPIQPASQPTQQPQQAQPAAQDDDEDWDSTVLSSSFTIKQAHKTYMLHNEATGQTILIDRSVLLGRRPSEAIPEGAKAVKIEDPTRTTSRNHAAISIDQDGQLWIEDYGSHNGTFIIRDGEEHQVVKGTPAQLEAPATLRIGDQFFTLEEQQ